MRLFASVDLDGREDAIEKLQAPLSGLSGLRVTDPADAHVTMTFLGEGDHDLEELSGALEAAIDATDTGPFEVTFGGVGAFPSPEYIRVVWLGVEDGATPLTALHHQLEAETTALGYEEPRHEFTPHVTLARMENAAAKEEVQGFLREADPEIGPLPVEELRLTESTLTEDGPAYRTIERVEL